MSRRTNRREFIKTSAVVGAGFWIAPAPAGPMRAKPKRNRQLRLHRHRRQGGQRRDQVANHGNIVAICDIDDNRLESKIAKFQRSFPSPGLQRLPQDVRSRSARIDVVTVSTPDHHHAVATMLAIKIGKAVYCQKPMTHTVAEARRCEWPPASTKSPRRWAIREPPRTSFAAALKSFVPARSAR